MVGGSAAAAAADDDDDDGGEFNAVPLASLGLFRECVARGGLTMYCSFNTYTSSPRMQRTTSNSRRPQEL